MPGARPLIGKRTLLLSSAVAGAVLVSTSAHADTTPPAPMPTRTVEPASTTPKPALMGEQTIIGIAATAEQRGDTSIRPFKFRASDEALAEMKRRIVATQWPEKETVSDESQGVPLATMQELARYWATDYDWRKAEAKLNGYPQFVTNIDGLDIHFIHVKSKEKNALPLVINHGWPGSILEQVKLIGPLTDPVAHGGKAEDAFDVVIPSMPGYGFSGKPTGTGWGPERMGRAWDVLMKRLGLHALRRPGRRLGRVRRRPDGACRRRQACSPSTPTCRRSFRPTSRRRSTRGSGPPAGLSADERQAYEQLVRTFKQVDYARIMGSRPQTLYGLADSPVFLAAWLLDHNDADAQPAAAVTAGLRRTSSATGELTRDEILDNITLYWLTNTGVSSSRLYWEYKGGFFNAKGVKIPVAVTVFPSEQYEAPRSWTERAYPKLIHYNRVGQGRAFRRVGAAGDFRR